jgi:hypothetical protein
LGNRDLVGLPSGVAGPPVGPGYIVILVVATVMCVIRT